MGFILFLSLLSITSAFNSKLFRASFLQTQEASMTDEDFEQIYDTKTGPMVEPPAGHGLPEFSKPPYELSAEELIDEYHAWQALEAEAEAAFYEQTDNAIAEAQAEKDNCKNIYETEEEIQACEAEAQQTIDETDQAVSDLQNSHGTIQEDFEAALEWYLDLYAREEEEAEAEEQAEEESVEEEPVEEESTEPVLIQKSTFRS